MLNRGGSTWNIQEKEAHEYYNEIPGKEPPAGGLLDIRVKVYTVQRSNHSVAYTVNHSTVQNMCFLLHLTLSVLRGTPQLVE